MPRRRICAGPARCRPSMPRVARRIEAEPRCAPSATSGSSRLASLDGEFAESAASGRVSGRASKRRLFGDRRRAAPASGIAWCSGARSRPPPSPSQWSPSASTSCSRAPDPRRLRHPTGRGAGGQRAATSNSSPSTIGATGKVRLTALSGDAGARQATSSSGPSRATNAPGVHGRDPGQCAQRSPGRCRLATSAGTAGRDARAKGGSPTGYARARSSAARLARAIRPASIVASGVPLPRI